MKLSNSCCMTKMEIHPAKMFYKIYRGRWQHGSSRFIYHPQKAPLYKVLEVFEVSSETLHVKYCCCIILSKYIILFLLEYYIAVMGQRCCHLLESSFGQDVVVQVTPGHLWNYKGALVSCECCSHSGCRSAVV